MMQVLFCLLLFLSSSVFSDNYIFPGCEVQRSDGRNDFNLMKTEKDSLMIQLSPLYSHRSRRPQPRVSMRQGLTVFRDINLPLLPYNQWSLIQVSLRDKFYVRVVSQNETVYPREEDQESLTEIPIKDIQVKFAYFLSDCPQGTPYKMENPNSIITFPSLQKKMETYLIFPLANMTLKFMFHRINHYLCWNQENSQMEMKDDRQNCSKLLGFRYHQIRFSFDNRQVTVMNRNKIVLGYLSMGNDVRVAFITEEAEGMFVIQCVTEDCEPPQPDEPITCSSNSSTAERNTYLPQDVFAEKREGLSLTAATVSILVLLMVGMIGIVGLLYRYKHRIVVLPDSDQDPLYDNNTDDHYGISKSSSSFSLNTYL